MAFKPLWIIKCAALGTAWGLFRHYWALFKLLIAVFITIVLLIYMEAFSVMASTAADPSAGLDVVRNMSSVLHAALALPVLLLATVLGVYKPRGMTRYGAHKQYEQRGNIEREASRRSAANTPRWVKVLGILTLTVVLLFFILLLIRGPHRGPGDHTSHSNVIEHGMQKP